MAEKARHEGERNNKDNTEMEQWIKEHAEKALII